MKNTFSFKLFLLIVVLLIPQFIPVVNTLLFFAPHAELVTILTIVLVFFVLPTDIKYGTAPKILMFIPAVTATFLLFAYLQYYQMYSEQQEIISELNAKISKEKESEPLNINLEDVSVSIEERYMPATYGIIANGYQVSAIYANHEGGPFTDEKLEKSSWAHMLLSEDDCVKVQPSFIKDNYLAKENSSCWYIVPKTPEGKTLEIKVQPFDEDEWYLKRHSKEGLWIYSQVIEYFLESELIHTQTKFEYEKIPLIPIPAFRCMLYTEGSGCQLDFDRKFYRVNSQNEDTMIISALGLTKDEGKFRTHKDTLQILGSEYLK
ncbi:MAG: hypothetical protein ACI9UJ_002308 [bacterium]|jgi:hypothetical protein